MGGTVTEGSEPHSVDSPIDDHRSDVIVSYLSPSIPPALPTIWESEVAGSTSSGWIGPLPFQETMAAIIVEPGAGWRPAGGVSAGVS